VSEDKKFEPDNLLGGVVELPPEVEDRPVEPGRGRKFKLISWGLGLATVVLVIVALVIVALSGGGSDKFTLVAKPTVVPGIPAELAYPGATRLVFDESFLRADPQTAEEYRNAHLEVLVTTDDFNKVVPYYESKLKALGYTFHDGYVSFGPCQGEECNSRIETTKANDSLVVGIVNAVGFNSNSSTPDDLRKQIKPGQTVIFHLIAPLSEAATTAVANGSLYTPTALPAPTPTPYATSTPIKAGATAYLGPDNHFWSDGLVSTGASAQLKASDHDVTFQIDWLIADASKIQMQVTIQGDPKYINVDFAKLGTLTDEAGRVYNLTYAKGYSTVSSTNTLTQQVWQTTPLPATTRKVIFTPGAGLRFKVTPISLDITSFKASGLPLVKAQPDVQTVVNGVKLAIPYAYFGADRTVLLFKVDFGLSETLRKALLPPGALLYNQSSPPSLAVSDDRGKVLNQEELAGPRPEGGMPAIRTLTLEPNGDLVLVLEPVAAGVKQVQVTLEGLEQKFDFTLDTLSQTSLIEGFKVPVADLLKSGVSQPGPTIKITDNIAVQIVDEQAKLDTAKKEVNLAVKFRFNAPLADGSSSKRGMSNILTLNCVSCKGIIGLPPVVAPALTPGNGPMTYETRFIYPYDSQQDSVELAISNVYYVLPGPWQITLPVER
jgi:hypothetical protein